MIHKRTTLAAVLFSSLLREYRKGRFPCIAYQRECRQDMLA